MFWEWSCIKWADGLYFPAWISGVNQWAHRGRFVGKLFYLPFLCFVMGKAKWLLTADGQWLGLNESKVFWCCWYNEDEVGQLIIATIWSYQSQTSPYFTSPIIQVAVQYFQVVHSKNVQMCLWVSEKYHRKQIFYICFLTSMSGLSLKTSIYTIFLYLRFEFILRQCIFRPSTFIFWVFILIFRLCIFILRLFAKSICSNPV